tara:strand:+ start:135 stop:998 length:864 start_codon:yes stop_codon:yes gene_type:complete
MVKNMIDLKEYTAANYNSTRLPNAQILEDEDKKNFKKDLLEGFDKICDLKGSFLNKPALVMGHGPSLLDIDKEKYKSHLKITCNNFHKINFLDDFRPDFWCAANSYDSIKVPFKICLEEKIKTLVTVPRLQEFSDLLEIAREDEKMHMVYPWLWEHQIFQNLLAQDHGLRKTYSRCNTVTNHMIAFALWLGCNPISVTGFDLSFHGALAATGMTHAGYSNSEVSSGEATMGEGRIGGKFKSIDAFDDPRERRQILGDLKYLCTLASSKKVQIHNLSYETNRLPKIIS